MRLTDAWLKAAKPRRERYDTTVANRRGLMVRVHPSGAVSFRFRYKRGKDSVGKPIQHVMVLGEYPELTLARAYDMHTLALEELAVGLDPIEERQKRQEADELARQEREGADTIASLVEQFVHRKLRAERWDRDAGKWVRDSRANIKARKRPDAAAALLGYVEAQGQGKRKPVPTLISELGKLKARDITRRQLIAFLDSIVERGAPVAANRVHALLAQMFTWAAAKDLIPASPMAGVERPGGEERPRQRVLTAQEVKAFWTKLPAANMAELTRLGLRLLLVTAQRRGELTFAKWSHFDLGGKSWTIPVELLKTSHARRAAPEPHVVPLSPLALELLRDLHKLTGEGEYVLPARADKRKGRSYSERVLSRAVRENADHFGIPHFTPHDLRRTAASFMTKLKVPRLHVEKVLNHSTGDIAEVYDRHDYLPEKRAALLTWGSHLQQIVAGKDSNVVELPRTDRRTPSRG
jgi:integrase